MYRGSKVVSYFCFISSAPSAAVCPDGCVVGTHKGRVAVWLPNVLEWNH